MFLLQLLLLEREARLLREQLSILQQGRVDPSPKQLLTAKKGKTVEETHLMRTQLPIVQQGRVDPSPTAAIREMLQVRGNVDPFLAAVVRERYNIYLREQLFILWQDMVGRSFPSSCPF
jgi:hypothetical protein